MYFPAISNSTIPVPVIRGSFNNVIRERKRGDSDGPVKIGFLVCLVLLKYGILSDSRIPIKLKGKVHEIVVSGVIMHGLDNEA